MATKKAKKAKQTDHAKAVLDAINKGLGKDAGHMALLRDSLTMQSVDRVVPTGIEVINEYLFGVGGLPGGRVIEVFSDEGGGKTSLMYDWLAAAQRCGGIAALLDAEQSFDPDRAKIFGVNVPDLLVSQPDHIDELLMQLELLVQVIAGMGPLIGTSVIVWDSVAASATKDEFDEGFETKEHKAKKAAAMSRVLRSLGPKLKKANIVLVCVNQIREKVGVVFGNKEVTPAGKALKFHSSLRLQLMGGKAVKDNSTGEHKGKVITFLVVKSRFTPPYRKALVRLDYATGWNNPWTTLSHAKDKKVIDKGTKLSTGAYNEAVKSLGWGTNNNTEEVIDVSTESEDSE